MKRIQTIFRLALLATLLTPLCSDGQTTDEKKLSDTILHLDSLFWQAYNSCDVEKMGALLTDDLEFYHDKGGLTRTKDALIEMTKKGMCGDGGWRLRREAVEGTVHVFPLNNYGALIT